MTTAINAVFIGLQLKNCYLVGGVNWILVGGGIKVWWGGGGEGGSLWGVGIFLGGKGISKFFYGGGTPGYDLTLIKKRHIKFLFAFTDVLIKNKNLQIRCW